jgi:hypothetical protein
VDIGRQMVRNRRGMFSTRDEKHSYRAGEVMYTLVVIL